MKGDYEKRVMLKLYRQYSKDEAVAFLKGKLDEALTERDALAEKAAQNDLQASQYRVIYHSCNGSRKYLEEALNAAHDEAAQLREALAAEKKAERMAFKESEAAKQVKAMQYDRRRLQAKMAMWRDRYAYLANTLLDGDVEEAKREAAMIIRPSDPPRPPGYFKELFSRLFKNRDQ